MRYLLSLALGLSALLFVSSCDHDFDNRECADHPDRCAATSGSIAITGPRNGVQVGVDAANPVLPIYFKVSNFTLADRGQCAAQGATGDGGMAMTDGGMAMGDGGVGGPTYGTGGGGYTIGTQHHGGMQAPAATCGHVELYVDGNTCHAPGQQYNNVGSSSPIEAQLGFCPMLAGWHQVAAVLVTDNATPLFDRFGNLVFSAVEVFVVVGDGGVPSGGLDGGVPGGGLDGGVPGGGADGGTATLCPDGSAPVAATSVTVADFSFTPKCIRVSPGATVTWTNTGMPIHTVTSDANSPMSFDSGALGSGGTFQLTFTAPGVVGYHCIPHQSLGMVGTVIVE